MRRRHIVPSARLPIVTQIALNLGFVLGGAITVEALFSWPGIGLATLHAIEAKDFPMLQGLYLVTSVLVIVCNLAADLLYAPPRPAGAHRMSVVSNDAAEVARRIHGEGGGVGRAARGARSSRSRARAAGRSASCCSPCS